MSDIIKYHTNKQICKPSVQDVVMYDPKRDYGGCTTMEGKLGRGDDMCSTQNGSEELFQTC